MKNIENFKTLSREELKHVKGGGGITLTPNQIEFIKCYAEAENIENEDAKAIMRQICADTYPL